MRKTLELYDKVRAYLDPGANREYCKTVYKPLVCNLAACFKPKSHQLPTSVDLLGAQNSRSRVFKQEILVDSSPSPTESLEKEVKQPTLDKPRLANCSHNCFFEEHVELDSSSHHPPEDNSGLEQLYQTVESLATSPSFRIHPRLFIDARGGLNLRKPLRLVAPHCAGNTFVLKDQLLFSKIPTGQLANKRDQPLLISALNSSGTAAQARKTKRRFHYISAVVDNQGCVTVIDLKKRRLLLRLPCAKFEDGFGSPKPGDRLPGGHLSTEDFWFGGKSVVLCFSWPSSRENASVSIPISKKGAECTRCGTDIRSPWKKHEFFVLGCDRPYSTCNQRVSSASTVIVYYPVSRKSTWIGLPRVRIRSLLLFPHAPVLLLGGDPLDSSPIENTISDREETEMDDSGYGNSQDAVPQGTVVCLQLSHPDRSRKSNLVKVIAREQFDIKSQHGDLALMYDFKKVFEIMDSGIIMQKKSAGGINGLIPGERIAEKFKGVAFMTQIDEESDTESEPIESKDYVTDRRSHPSKYPKNWLDDLQKVNMHPWSLDSRELVRKRLFRKFASKSTSKALPQSDLPEKVCTRCKSVSQQSFSRRVGATSSSKQRAMNADGHSVAKISSAAVDASESIRLQQAHYNQRFLDSWRHTNHPQANTRQFLAARLLRELTDSRSSTPSAFEASPEAHSADCDNK